MKDNREIIKSRVTLIWVSITFLSTNRNFDMQKNVMSLKKRNVVTQSVWGGNIFKTAKWTRKRKLTSTQHLYWLGLHRVGHVFYSCDPMPSYKVGTFFYKETGAQRNKVTEGECRRLARGSARTRVRVSCPPSHSRLLCRHWSFLTVQHQEILRES